MKITQVTINTIPPKQMRYRTVGDWFFVSPGDLTIQVADTGDWRANMLVAIHELCEVFLCVEKGIAQKQVDRFDTTHASDEDPGSHPKSPYHDQHITAMAVEMLLSVGCGMKWRPYEELLDKTWKKTPRKKL